MIPNMIPKVSTDGSFDVRWQDDAIMVTCCTPLLRLIHQQRGEGAHSLVSSSLIS